MTGLSQEQIEKRASIQKSALIWGVVVGVIVALLAMWLLGGQGSAVRYGGAIVIGLVAAFLVHRASFYSGSKSARCAKCDAAFSISRTDRSETVTDSTDKEEREEQDDGSVEVTTWIEDRVHVIETFTCASCGDVTTKERDTTRRRDEEKTTIPKPEPVESKSGQKDTGKSGKTSKSGSSRSKGRRG